MREKNSNCTRFNKTKKNLYSNQVDFMCIAFTTSIRTCLTSIHSNDELSEKIWRWYNTNTKNNQTNDLAIDAIRLCNCTWCITNVLYIEKHEFCHIWMQFRARNNLTHTHFVRWYRHGIIQIGVSIQYTHTLHVCWLELFLVSEFQIFGYTKGQCERKKKHWPILNVMTEKIQGT